MEMPKSQLRDPKTKAEVLNRMFSFDFDGDIRHLGAEPARLERTALNRAQITFPASNTTFELVIRRPREFAKVAPKKTKNRKNAPAAQEEGGDNAPPAPAQSKRTTVRRKRS